MDDQPVDAPAESVPAVAAPPGPTAPPAGELPGEKRVRPPREDMLEEIRLLVRGGVLDEARRRVETLRTLGYASPELDEVERAIEQPVAAAPPQQAPAGQAADDSVEGLAAAISETDEDDDLSTITAALESELFADDSEPPVPEAQTEQSLEDVFAAFREHVAEEVGSEDFRTHYDLGIAYKEMGLMDEAVAEFQIAVKSSEILREAAIMLALCHREREEKQEAVGWYRRAIEAPGGDAEAAYGLRYEFAELLLETGNIEGALEQFRDVLSSNPSFRDVRERVEQLEARLTS
jgi:tetratricopeptide (TPR) repeat protein